MNMSLWQDREILSLRVELSASEKMIAECQLRERVCKDGIKLMRSEMVSSIPYLTSFLSSFASEDNRIMIDDRSQKNRS